MSDRQNGNAAVHTTKDYGMFLRLEGNRDVLDARVRTIGASVERVGWLPIPIIVNEKNEVVDGQGRLEYARQNGLDVYYVVIPGIGIRECESINTSSAKWTQTDFIKSFAERGNKNYIRLLELCDEFAGVFAMSNVICAATGKKTATKEIKDGTFVFTAEGQDNTRFFLESISGMFDNNKRISGRDNIIIALLFIINNTDANIDRLSTVLRDRSDSINTTTIDTTVETIEAAYNFGLSRNKQKSFLFKYRLSKK